MKEKRKKLEYVSTPVTRKHLLDHSHITIERLWISENRIPRPDAV